MVNIVKTVKDYAKALKNHPPTPEPPKDLVGGGARDRFSGRVLNSTQDGGRIEIRIAQSSHSITMLEDGAEDLYNWLGTVLGK